MGEFGNWPFERVVNLRLTKSIVQMVVAADDMGDLHVVIVHHHRKIVGRRAVRPQDDKIVEFAIGDRDLALNVVAYRRRALLLSLEPDNRGDADWSLGRVA